MTKLNLLNKDKSSDLYYTPKEVWNNVKHLLPKYASYVEPFMLNTPDDNVCSQLIEDGWFIAYDKDTDFFNRRKQDWYQRLNSKIIIGNPPFSIKNKILKELVEEDIPFCLILPIDTICRKYFIDLFKDKKIQLIIPSKRINFIIPDNDKKSSAFFDCAYFCYKLELEDDIIMI